MYYLECHMMILQFLWFWKWELEYKSIYMSSYVCPYIVIKKIEEIYKTILHKVANVSIKPISRNLTEYTNTSANNEWQKDDFWKKSEFTKFKYF